MRGVRGDQRFGRWRGLGAALALIVGVVQGVGRDAEPVKAQPAATYTNPVAGGATANPFVLKAPDGSYYAYVNGFDFGVPFPALALRSTDLATWTQVGNVLPPASAGAWADTSTGRNFTSPSVLHVPNNPAASRYVMYFTAKRAGSTERCIGVATASSPAGPFTGAAQPLICPPGGAQDPSPVPLGSNPSYQQIVYRTNGPNPAIYNQVLNPDGLSIWPGINPFLLYRPQPTWWQQGVVERPAIAYDGSGGIHLFFSGAPANTASRAIGWSRCTEGFGIVNDCTRLQTGFGTWMAGTAHVASPSGPQVFSDGTHQWLVYDGLLGGSCSGGGACTGTRSMRLDRLCFGHGQPRTNGPSSGPQSLGRSTTCSVDVPGATLNIQSVSETMLLPQSSKVSARDGGQTVPLDGRVLWMFSDTLTPNACPDPSNTAALGVPAAGATGPGWNADAGSSSCPTEFMRLTSGESAYNQQHSACAPSPTCDGKRLALWTLGAIPHNDGTALSFLLKLIHDQDNDGEIVDPGTGAVNEDGNGDGYADEGCDLCYTFLGVGVARVPSGSTAVPRDIASSPVGCNPTDPALAATATRCLFDYADTRAAFGNPVVDGGFVYLYSDGRHRDDGPIEAWLARAPLAEVQNRSAWRFWTDAPSWSPNPRDADSVPGLREEGHGPLNWETSITSVSYNPYLDKFVNFVGDFNGANEADPWGLHEMVLQIAPAPEGPWSPEQVIYDARVVSCGPGDRPYGFVEAPPVNMAGGRNVFVTYARPGLNFGADPNCPGQMRMVEVRLGP